MSQADTSDEYGDRVSKLSKSLGKRKLRPDSGASSGPKQEPSSPLTRILHQLRDDIVPTHSPCQPVAPVYDSPHRCYGPVSGLQEVYIQHPSGKFKLASKEIALAATLSNTSQCHLDELTGTPYESPLDMAILIQKLWTNFSKICFGLLGGVSLFHLLLVDRLLYWDTEGSVRFLEPYSTIASILPTCFYLFLVICIVSLFDRFDLAHIINTRHLSDKVAYQQTWPLLILYFLTLLITLGCVHMDEKLIFYPLIPQMLSDDVISDESSCKQGLQESQRTNDTSVGDCGLLTSEEMWEMLTIWKTVNYVRCLLAIIGWCIVGVSQVQDLLLVHLVSLKKYDRKVPAQ